MMSVQEIINPKYIDQHAIVRDSFINGNPFKHFLFTDFLQDSFLDSILVEFPVPPDLNALKNEFGQSNRRHAVHKIIDLGPTFQAWDELLKSEKFIRWLCNVTGIPGLLYDPEYHGAGTHNNLHGQDLDVHVDFNLHRTTGFHRRLNLIIYLNKGWQPEWGGGLSLHKNPWDPEEDESIVYPCKANYAVLFETNENSWHGFDTINLPEDKRHLSRKSLTVYYYAKERPEHEIVPKRSTIYTQKPLPPTIKPGHTISYDDYEALQQIIKKRNRYIKGMYNRESQLLERIENFKHRLHLYQEHQRISMSGRIRQVSTPSGILPNNKVTSDLKLQAQLVHPQKTLTISGTIPHFVNDGVNSITINCNGRNLGASHEVKGSFRVTVELPSYSAGSILDLLISCQFYQSPADVGKGTNTTKVGFVLNELTFDE